MWALLRDDRPHSRVTPEGGGADLRVAPWPRPPRRLIHASHARGASQSVTIAARTKPGNMQWQTKGGSSGENGIERHRTWGGLVRRSGVSDAEGVVGRGINGLG